MRILTDVVLFYPSKTPNIYSIRIKPSIVVISKHFITHPVNVELVTESIKGNHILDLTLIFSARFSLHFGNVLLHFQ